MEILGCFGVLAMVPIIAIFRAYVLSVLWGWFVVPAFHVPAPSLVLLIGLSLLVGMFFDGLAHSHELDRDQSDTAKIVSGIVNAFVSPAMALAFGAIVHHFA